MSVFSTKGHESQEENKYPITWLRPKQVSRAKVVDLKCNANSNGNIFFKLVIMSVTDMCENGGETPYKALGNGKICESEPWYITDAAAKHTGERLATLRDVFNVPQMDNVEAASASLEDMTAYAEELKKLLVGKEGLWLIGGKRNAEGKVYAHIYPFNFVLPNTPENLQKMQEYVDAKGDKMISEDKSAKADGGSSTSEKAAPDFDPNMV